MSDIQAVRYHDGERVVSALVKFGNKHMHAVVIDDSGVRVVSEPLTMQRHCSPLLLGDKPYPVGRMVKHLRRVGRERGITEAAKAIIEEVV